ncbi:hypothetical protein ABZ835_14630 [Streptomyces sp. NPDC047461]|uniref:hypothetical protein n=1 Tax=Streptomyces sp. NPDC047461 TaxID=3155619 RepID=UPI00340A8BF0
MKSGVPPWVLIVVAAITALATLLAAAISGLIAYRTSRRSIEHAADMARLDREAEKDAQHRSARRDAYAAYVTAGLTALRDISAARQADSASQRWQELRQQAVASSHAVVIAYGVVEVEGPPQVADSAKAMYEAINDYRRKVVKRYDRETSEDGTEVVITVSEPGEEADSSGRLALRALRHFVATAREILSG